MNLSKLFFFILPFCFFTSIFAIEKTCSELTNSKTLSLEEAIMLALRNNPEIRSAELQRIVDKFSLEVARNQFFPKYTLETSAVYSNGNKPYYTTNPSTTLETILGTQLELGLQDQINAGRETVAFLEVKQPLLQGANPAANKAPYYNAFQQEIISKLLFKEKVSSVVNQVIKNYYKLVQDYNNIKIAQLSLVQSLKLFQTMQLRIKAGKMAPTEITQQQAHLTALKMVLTRENNILSQDYRQLLLLLGLDPRAQLMINKAIPLQIAALPNPEDAVNIALVNNVDYQMQIVKLKQFELALAVAKNERKWKLDVIGRAQQPIIRNQNFATVPIDQISAIGNDRAGSDRSVILNLKIPIHDVNSQQKLIQASIALKQFQIELETKRKQLTAQVLTTLESLQTQLTQIQLAKESVCYSQQSLDVAKKKFFYGRSTTFEITTLQRDLLSQEINSVTEQIGFLNNLIDFEKFLGVTLQKWHINIPCT